MRMSPNDQLKATQYFQLRGRVAGRSNSRIQAALNFGEFAGELPC